MESYVISIAIISVTCVSMEFVAWAIHKYIMHGIGWSWHESHHQEHDDTLERNDYFAVVFGALSFGMMLISHVIFPLLYWVGVGMALYGLLYFIVHDGMTHNRWPAKYIPQNGYLKRLVLAHRLHHGLSKPNSGMFFGFLYAPPTPVLKVRVREHLAKVASTRT